MAVHALASVDEALAWLRGRGARALSTDSRRVEAGGAFIAWPGYAADGRRFVADACAAGAVACLVEAEGVEAFAFGDAAPVASLRGLKEATGELAARFEGRPSERLDVVACTGTNGKTSTAWWVAQALSALGRRCGVVGTLGVGEPPRADGGAGQAIAYNGLTTPDPVTLQAALRRFADAGFGACALEASSIGLAEHRLAGTAIDVGVFTNFTQDHLDYHGDMARYWRAKAALFAWPGLRTAVVNVDDAQGASLAAELGGGAVDLWTVSKAAQAGPAARLQAHRVRSGGDGGLVFELREAGAEAAVHTALIGDYNVSNLLGVVGALRALGVSLPDAARACAGLTPVPGRMQRVLPPQAGARPLPEVVVDYAHTPDALDKALLALGPWAAQRGGALWCVFGCGGDRDAAKRPLMGAVAERRAAHVVLTSDNPRGESPQAILAQVAQGLSAPTAAVSIEDRRQAIRHAVLRAGPRDIVLLAGKGHEDTQEIAGRKLPFSDAAEALAALAGRAQSLEVGA